MDCLLYRHQPTNICRPLSWMEDLQADEYRESLIAHILNINYSDVVHVSDRYPSQRWTSRRYVTILGFLSSSDLSDHTSLSGYPCHEGYGGYKRYGPCSEHLENDGVTIEYRVSTKLDDSRGYTSGFLGYSSPANIMQIDRKQEFIFISACRRKTEQ